MFEAGAATCKKEHEAYEKDEDRHGIHDMYDNIGSDSKLLGVTDKDMGSDLCKSLYACTPRCHHWIKKPATRGHGYRTCFKISVGGNLTIRII